MDFRTDLALERHEILNTHLQGVRIKKTEDEECTKTYMEILNEDAAKKLGKGVGKYITLEMLNFSDDAPVSQKRLSAVTESLKELIPPGEGCVLVAGVGNALMTSDSLGPETASKIIATRHIGAEMKKAAGLNSLQSVAAVSTGVLGQTGIESGEYIECICHRVMPKCVISIDALAAGSVSRLGTTIQMSNTGIAPGSGIGNKRKRIDEELLGVPVIAVGVPTVVDAFSLASELKGASQGAFAPEELKGLIVASKDVDLLVKNASYLLALSINCALQPSLTAKEIYALM